MPEHCKDIWLFILLRGTIVNRTYGTYKNLYIYLFLTNNIWFYLLWSPVITPTRSSLFLAEWYLPTIAVSSPKVKDIPYERGRRGGCLENTALFIKRRKDFFFSFTSTKPSMLPEARYCPSGLKRATSGWLFAPARCERNTQNAFQEKKKRGRGGQD